MEASLESEVVDREALLRVGSPGLLVVAGVALFSRYSRRGSAALERVHLDPSSERAGLSGSSDPDVSEVADVEWMSDGHYRMGTILELTLVARRPRERQRARETMERAFADGCGTRRPAEPVSMPAAT